MSKRLLTLLSLAVVVNVVPPAMALGEEFIDPGKSGCYVYFDGLVFTYWEEDNFLHGLQRDWTKQGSLSIPPDKYHGWHPTYWGIGCVLLGTVNKLCEADCVDPGLITG